MSFLRKIPKKSSQTYEAFIFEVNSRKRSKIIKLLSQKGFGTKNLPDAIKWHCSYFWGRGLGKKEIHNSLVSKEKLSKNIAIPIFLKKTIKEYFNLANKISKIN